MHLDDNDNQAALFLTNMGDNSFSPISPAEEMELERKMSDKGISEAEKKELDEWLFR